MARWKWGRESCATEREALLTLRARLDCYSWCRIPPSLAKLSRNGFGLGRKVKELGGRKGRDDDNCVSL
eukprot:534825-Amorphochlora_amoeboformis.AAC.1